MINLTGTEMGLGPAIIYYNVVVYFLYQASPNYADQPVEVQVFSRGRIGGRKAPQGFVLIC